MKRSLYINSHCTLQRDQNTLLLELEDGTKRYLPIERRARTAHLRRSRPQ